MATQRRPEYLQNTPGLAPWCRNHLALPSTLGSCGFPEGNNRFVWQPFRGTTRRLPVHWGLADSQREQPQLEMWRRSQGNTRQQVEVLGLIVVSTVSSPMRPAAADLLDFEESLKGLQLPWGPATTCVPSESWCCQPLIFARWAGGSRKWSITLHTMAEPLSVEGP